MLKSSIEFDWKITVADSNKKLAAEKIHSHQNATAIAFDIKEDEKRRELIQQHDFVISMLPAFMHGDVARDCVEFGKHMATASYVSADMKALDQQAKDKGLLLLNECGLDPGIDHASAMKIIDEIKEKEGEVTSFKSFCGGLVAPESNDNPWGYKFSWNPRNVVLAGQGTAQYLDNGHMRFIPYNRLFTQIDTIEVEPYGKFDAYANRDSIGYIDAYGLYSINTMLRGTLRQQGYCKAWNVFIKLGLTDDTSRITHAGELTYTSLIDSFLPGTNKPVKQKLKELMKDEWDEEIEHMLEYLEIFNDKKISLKEGSPAQLLQNLLEEKWKLKAEDKDMIVMQHQFEYRLPTSEQIHRINSSLAVVGRDQHHTAMALTVGLPLAITVKNFLNKKFSASGVVIPTSKEIYEPLLTELQKFQIIFNEEVVA
jgi:saccharopine dehydrogenase-like NADP-dependent oxidoreductase